MKRQTGFTLTEMMIALLVLAILGSFALPAYQSYVETSQQGTLRASLLGIEVFQEDLFLRTGAYAATIADTGWVPQGNDGVTYTVEDAQATFYEVQAVHPDGMTVCIRLPDRVPCP